MGIGADRTLSLNIGGDGSKTLIKKMRKEEVLIGPGGRIITRALMDSIIRERLHGRPACWVEMKDGRPQIVRGYIFDDKTLRSLRERFGLNPKRTERDGAIIT